MTALPDGDPATFLDRVRMLAEIALREWELDVISVQPIKVRENAVFRLDLANAGHAALRVHRLGYHSDSALRSEFAWMEALGRAGIDVPKVIPSRHGNPFELAVCSGLDGARQIDVFQWIEGRQLGVSGDAVQSDAKTVSSQYFTIGAIMARMHNQATTWPLPAGFVRHSWDSEGLVGAAPLWGPFWELEALSPGQRELMQRIRAVVSRELAAYGRGADRFGLIHADLVPENVLVDGANVRVIDFDDAGFGWHLFDIATSLYFLTPDSVYPLARDALLRGYRSGRALSEDAVGRLPLLMAARATTYLGWVHTRQGTETARELTPFLVDLACSTAEDCLRSL